MFGFIKNFIELRKSENELNNGLKQYAKEIEKKYKKQGIYIKLDVGNSITQLGTSSSYDSNIEYYKLRALDLLIKNNNEKRTG